MIVMPVNVFAPDSTQVPEPDFVREVAPVLSPIIAAIVLEPVFVPSRVRVLAVVLPLKPMDPVLVKFTAPVPDAAIVLEACKEKRRLVLTAAPV